MSSKNSMVAVAADRGAASLWRAWFYPPGAKEVKITLQAVNGWVTLDPDPNRGFIVTHMSRPRNQSGRWLRGPMSVSAHGQDVKIARALIGHRPWMVSTWRVHFYRAFVFGLIMAALAALDLANVGVALFAAFLIFLVPSPCTPRGLILWCENMGWEENRLTASTGLDENGLERMRSMVKSSESH